jgi:nucleoside-diphosphate-sugar epimerase
MEMLSRFVRGGRATVFGTPRRRWHFVAVRDFARMVVESYRRPEARDKRFYVHGPEALTVREALRAYCRALHPDIEPRSTPYWVLRVVARLRGNAALRAGIAMVAYLERVGERGDPTEANAILGAPELTLDQWLQTRRLDAQARRRLATRLGVFTSRVGSTAARSR